MAENKAFLAKAILIYMAARTGVVRTGDLVAGVREIGVGTKHSIPFTLGMLVNDGFVERCEERGFSQITQAGRKHLATLTGPEESADRGDASLQAGWDRLDEFGRTVLAYVRERGGMVATQPIRENLESNGIELSQGRVRAKLNELASDGWLLKPEWGMWALAPATQAGQAASAIADASPAPVTEAAASASPTASPRTAEQLAELAEGRVCGFGVADRLTIADFLKEGPASLDAIFKHLLRNDCPYTRGTVCSYLGLWAVERHAVIRKVKVGVYALKNGASASPSQNGVSAAPKYVLRLTPSGVSAFRSIVKAAVNDGAARFVTRPFDHAFAELGDRGEAEELLGQLIKAGCLNPDERTRNGEDSIYTFGPEDLVKVEPVPESPFRSQISRVRAIIRGKRELAGEIQRERADMIARIKETQVQTEQLHRDADRLERDLQELRKLSDRLAPELSEGEGTAANGSNGTSPEQGRADARPFPEKWHAVESASGPVQPLVEREQGHPISANADVG